MNAAKILVVEDDPTTQGILKDNLEFCGHEVRIAADGRAGWLAFREFAPDLILLDIMLPEISGFDLCQRIRKEDTNVSIIMLTAKGQESDIVLGLNLGADDYVTKPFSIDVLLARVSARLRNRTESETNRVRFGDCEVDFGSHKLFREGKEVPLTPKEFGLLKYLIRNEGRALTRDRILEAVWGQDLIVTRRSVDRCVNTLRDKIEADPQNPRLIQTVRDIGYRFEAR
jgi:DNA-binding response OmpR family regulator